MRLFIFLFLTFESAVFGTNLSLNSQELMVQCKKILASERVQIINSQITPELCESIQNKGEGMSLEKKLSLIKMAKNKLNDYLDIAAQFVQTGPLCDEKLKEQIENDKASTSIVRAKIRDLAAKFICNSPIEHSSTVAVNPSKSLSKSRSLASQRESQRKREEELDREARYIEQHYLDTDAIIDRN